MAQQLSKDSIAQNQIIRPWHVTQSIDALTGTAAYDITLSGSLTTTGSVNAQQLNVTTTFTASGLRYPIVDGTDKEVLKTNGSGLLEFGHVDAIYETIQAGEPLAKTDPVYLSGSQGAVPIAYKADPSDPAKSPAVYICNETIATGQRGDAIALGLIEGIDLTGLEAGTAVYLGVGGGWTPIRPTGSAAIQTLGIVTKGGNGGKGVVFNAGEATLPNITEGYTWVGDSNYYPQAVTTASIIGAGSYGGVYQSGSVAGISGPVKFIAGASETDGSGAATVAVLELVAGGIRILNQTCFVTATAESSTPGYIITVDPAGAPPNLLFKSNGPNIKFHFQIMYI